MPFKTGIPYDEILNRLDAELSPRPGDLFTHEQLRAIIQPCSDNRYRGALAAWKRRLEKQKKLTATGTGRARGIGIMICSGHEHAALVDRQIYQVHDKADRTAKSVEDVDTKDFNEAEINHHNIRRREAHALADFAARSAKAIRSVPKAIEGSNVRVLRQN